MNFPPRLGHLATRQVVVAKLWPTYSETHHLEEGEAMARLGRALQGSLWEELLAATWTALLGKTKKLDEDGLLEKVAKNLKDRPQKPGRLVKVTPALSAFLVMADLEAGTASDAVRRVLESPEGRKKTAEGLIEAGKVLADELSR